MGTPWWVLVLAAQGAVIISGLGLLGWLLLSIRRRLRAGAPGAEMSRGGGAPGIASGSQTGGSTRGGTGRGRLLGAMGGSSGGAAGVTTGGGAGDFAGAAGGGGAGTPAGSGNGGRVAATIARTAPWLGLGAGAVSFAVAWGLKALTSR